jgi:DNA-binding transcriptional regulator YdaS (Cro superfamily)
MWRGMADWKDHLNRAVRLLGSQNRLAEAMGCSQSKISWLIITAKEIGAEDALAIDRATNGEVPASQLRPDLWPTHAHVPPRQPVPEPERQAS